MTLLGRWWKAGSDEAELQAVDDEAPDEAPEVFGGLLDGIKPRHARYLSAFAAVLARVAYIDREVTADEAEMMTQIIQRVDDVPPADARLIVAIALGGARTVGEEDGREAAQTLGLVATRAQRLGLLRCLFAVAAAHSGISAEEHAKIEQIGQELALNATDLATCRLELGRLGSSTSS
jgi:tellurite resistance protein